MTSTIVYKATTASGEVLFANDFTYPLPSGNRKGKWVHYEGKPIEYYSGLNPYQQRIQPNDTADS